MATMDLVHPDVLILRDLLLAEWPAARERIHLSGHPTCEGDDDAGDGADDDKDDTGGDDAAGAANKDDDGDAGADEAKVAADDDWRTKARKHETRAKRAESERTRLKRENEELAAKLAKIEQSNLSEQEKAIARAREEAATEVTTKYEAERRSDRIEHAVTKLSLKGFKGKDSDGKDITLRFADPEDAQLRLDRALRNNDIAYDDIYADGKVRDDALVDFLTDLLEEHPRLRATDTAATTSRAKDKDVDFDGGKGKGNGSKALEDMSPDDHLKEIQGRR